MSPSNSALSRPPRRPCATNPRTSRSEPRQVPPEATRRVSVRSGESLLERRKDSINGTVPKYGSGDILPIRAWHVEDDFIPMEIILYAAVRLRLSGLLPGDAAQFSRHEVLRIPKLPGARVGNPRQGASSG